VLFDLLLGAYRKYGQLLNAYPHTTEEFKVFFPDWKSIRNDERAIGLRQSLMQWSQRWNLDEDWCRDAAIKAIRLWLYSKDACLCLCWTPLQTIQFLENIGEKDRNPKCVDSIISYYQFIENRDKNEGFDDDIFLTNPPPDYPEKPPGFRHRLFSLESIKDYLNSYEKALEGNALLSALPSVLKSQAITFLVMSLGKKYCNEVDRFYKARGWEKVRKKPERNKHANWAVLYQVKELEYSAIAAAYGATEQTVAQETGQFLKEIGLKNRRRRGAPSKKDKGSPNPSKNT
jgi:hypothetical protein